VEVYSDVVLFEVSGDKMVSVHWTGQEMRVEIGKQVVGDKAPSVGVYRNDFPSQEFQSAPTDVTPAGAVRSPAAHHPARL
jgi:hypothetical protein